MDDARDDVNDLRRMLIALLPGFALADGAQAQDAAMVQPSSYKVMLENDKLRALDYRARPGMGVCGQGMHSHPAHLTVVLFDGRVRVKTPDGNVKEVTGRIGDVFWSEAETHEVENLSGRNSRAVLIELKGSKA